MRSYLNLKTYEQCSPREIMTCEGRNLPRPLIARKLISSIAAYASWSCIACGESQPTRKLPNARVDVHVHVHGLICDYCERLRRRAHVAAPAVLDIENVISCTQCDAIIFILVRGTRVISFCLSSLKTTNGYSA